MSTPTIDQRCYAQDKATRWNPYRIVHLLTADELRAVLVENEELRSAERLARLQLDLARKQRDQWRECARELVRAYNEGIIYEHSAALARFDALVKEEKIRVCGLKG